MRRNRNVLLCAVVMSFALLAVQKAKADGDLHKVNHIIIVMQENHSFDNYFGALAYAPGSPYHSPDSADQGCRADDNQCADGLSCVVDPSGTPICSNSNPDDDGDIVVAFHDSRRCVVPDLDHSWFGTHLEANFSDPNNSLTNFLADGFVRVNDLMQIDNGEDPTEDQTMNFYNQNEIPFYYGLAENFALSDHYFASVLGQTFPNRSYLLAATSFGHLTTNDIVPPPGGYKPITGTILDLLDANHVSWADYFQDAPQAVSFRPVDSHYLPLNAFLLQAALGLLPQVSFVDPNFGVTGTTSENDEHPPTDIQRGQAYVSRVINAVRNGPNWRDSIIILTYDEHGGYYDHVAPPPAAQGDQLTPDGIAPGQCEDLSNPPASLQPGGGAECSYNFVSLTDTTLKQAELLCPDLANDPTGPYPDSCANFNQLGIRVPFVAISPFSKPQYVSHTVGDHASLLALIEKRFFAGDDHLTLRDLYANTLEDLFDFDNAPSLHTPVGQAGPPVNDCTP